MDKHLTYFDGRRKWRPLGMSLITHSLLVLILFLLWSFSFPATPAGDEIRRGGIVLAKVSENSVQEFLSETDNLQDLENANSQPKPAAVHSDSPPALPAESLTVPDRPGIGLAPIEIADANQMSVTPNQLNLPAAYTLSDADLKLIEADRKLIASRQPVGDPATISVFGSDNLTGRDFVFVIDRSKSMGAGGLGVIEASRFELATAIDQLESHHQFQIVGYHERTVTMKTRNLLPATPENKKQVPGYIANLVAFGGTEHENGLIAALVFDPDVIVFMTDGGYPELNDNQLKMIQPMAGDKTQIHCIQFGNGSLQKRQNFMTRLAAQNNGSFRYIDVNQWDQ